MHFSILAPVALLVGFVAAQSGGSSGPNSFNVPPTGLHFQAGKQADINWTPSGGGTVSITLRSGTSNDLSKGTVIAKSVPNNGKFSWTPPQSTKAGGDYALQISSDANPSQTNYSPQFPIVNNSPAAAASGSSASASGASASASASGSASAKSASSSAAMSSAASASASASSAAASTNSAASASASMTDSSASSTAASAASAATSMGGSETSSVPSPNQTGGAAALKVGSGLLAVMAAGMAVL